MNEVQQYPQNHRFSGEIGPIRLRKVEPGLNNCPEGMNNPTTGPVGQAPLNNQIEPVSNEPRRSSGTKCPLAPLREEGHGFLPARNARTGLDGRFPYSFDL